MLSGRKDIAGDSDFVFTVADGRLGLSGRRDQLKGFLSVGTVLFVGLAVGGFAPKAAEVLKTI